MIRNTAGRENVRGASRFQGLLKPGTRHCHLGIT